MDKLLEMLVGFNPVSITVRLLLALLMGGIIGMERGRHGRASAPV